MKSIKSSKIIKTLCFLLSLLFLSGVAANVIIGLLLTKSNLLYAEKDMLKQIVYEELVDHYNNADVQRYLEESLAEEHNYKRELELYQTKFSKEKSNLSFLITDENGETLLNNFPANDKEYTFTKTIRIYEHNDSYYGDWSEPTMTEETTTPPAPTAEHETTPPETTVVSIPAEETATAEDTTAAPAEAPTAAALLTVAETTTAYSATEPQTDLTEHLYLLDETGNLNDSATTRFKYIYYGETYNEVILNYCKQFYSSEHDWYCDYAEMTDGWMIFRENEFAVSDNGVVYYKGPSEATTYIFHTGEDYPHTDYNVTYTLPKTLTAKDLFYYAEKLTGFAHGYIRHLVLLTVLYALAAALFYILLLVCCGHVKGIEAPVARGLHRIPYDIVCVIALVTIVPLTFFLIDDLSYGGPVPLLVWGMALALSVLLFLETTVVRIKAKTIGNNIFVVRFFRWIVSLLRNASENRHLLLILGIVFGAVSLAELVYSLLLCQEDEFILLLFIAKVIEIPLVLLAAVNMNRVQNGAKRLAEGNLTEKVDMKYLVGPFRKNAEYLNAVNDGVNKAVNERMKSESMKTELITNVSHDLKTPLTSIINYIDLLKGTDVRDEKALEYIGVIDRQSQRLKKLCADIVDASKAATGNLEIHAERTALNVMLGQVIGEYDERLKERSLTLIPEMPDHDVFINADGRQLWRVFDNLLNNVCKYAMSGTRVYLSLQHPGSRAVLVIRNISGTALNISPEELTERFVRGDASRNTEGSGLGLSIAKSITELMGGTFHIAIDGDLFKVMITFPTVA